MALTTSIIAILGRVYIDNKLTEFNLQNNAVR